MSELKLNKLHLWINYKSNYLALNKISVYEYYKNDCEAVFLLINMIFRYNNVDYAWVGEYG